jgi:hypothetical protein
LVATFNLPPGAEQRWGGRGSIPLTVGNFIKLLQQSLTIGKGEEEEKSEEEEE